MSSACGRGGEDTNRASPRFLQACLALLSHLCLHLLRVQHTATDLRSGQSDRSLASTWPSPQVPRALVGLELDLNDPPPGFEHHHQWTANIQQEQGSAHRSPVELSTLS